MRLLSVELLLRRFEWRFAVILSRAAAGWAGVVITVVSNTNVYDDDGTAMVRPAGRVTRKSEVVQQFRIV